MRSLGLIVVALGGLVWFASDAQARDPLSVQTLTHVAPIGNASIGVEATPVRVGYGWRGPGYYPGGARPYYSNGYYSNGYRGGYYGNYYRPYSHGNYGSYYRAPYYNSYRAPYYRYY